MNGLLNCICRYQRPFLSFVVLAIGVCLPAEVFAAGYFLPGRGVRAMSNTGAIVAGCDDLSAQWYNPANLADGSTLSLMVDSAVVFLGSSFKRQEGGVTAENNGSPQVIPSIAVATNFGNAKLPTFALGFYTPYSAASKYAEDGVTRYSLVDNSGTMIAFLQLSAAYEVVKGLKIGIGLQNVFAKVRQVSAASTYTGLFGTPEDARLDMYNELVANDMATFSGNLGVTYTPRHHSSIAFSVQLPYRFNGSGTMQFRIPESYFFNAASVTGEEAQLKLKFPPVFRLGYRFRYKKLWEAEMSLVYEVWSVHKDVTIQPQGITLHDIPGLGDHTLQEIVIPHNYKDAVSVRLGGSYHFPYNIEARLGLSLETSAIPDATLDPALIDSLKVGLGVGLSYSIKRFRFDLSYGYLFFAPRNIADSEVTQINPTNPSDATIIGNGEYRANVHMLGLAVNFSL